MNEFRINSNTISDQINPSITGLSNGKFVVAWQSQSQDGSGFDVYGQVFSNFGVPEQNEFRINSNTISDQINPSITGLSNSKFVVAWQSQSQSGSGFDIYGQVFSNFGVPEQNEFRINSNTISDQINPSITGLSNGKFVVAWQSQGGSGFDVYGQVFSNFGVPEQNEFRINSNTISDQINPSITGLSNGKFVVAWQSQSQGGSGFDVYGQVFSNFGVPEQNEFRVNSNTISDQINPSMTGLSNDKFVVAWQSQIQGGSGFDVYGQVFSNFGVPEQNEFRINSNTISDQINPSITGLSNGKFVVAWQSQIQGGSGFDVYGQVFSNFGVPEQNEFRINSNTISDQINPSITGLSNNKFVVAWQSQSQDGSGFEIYATIINASNAGIELTTTTTQMSITTSTAPTTTTPAPPPPSTTTTTEIPTTTTLSPDTTAAPTTLIPPTAPVGVSSSSDAFNAQMDNSIFVSGIALCGVIMGEFLL